METFGHKVRILIMTGSPNMYCQKCGKGEQKVGTYCRNCGEYLIDPSSRSFLINTILGGSSPTTQIYVNLALSLVTILTSFLLIGFLNGYYDALEARTGASTPNVIYLVYAFLAVTSVWQFFSIIVGVRLRTKLGRSKTSPETRIPDIVPEDLPVRETRRITPQPLSEGKLPPSVTEESTRILENVNQPKDRSFDRK
jgi:hypothetical protein